MAPKGSLPRLQEPATCPYPQPDQSNPCTPPILSHFLKISSNLCLGLPSGIIPSCFPTKTLSTPFLSPICATFPAHLILLDLITRIISGEECRSVSSSLCNFLQSPVMLSLLGHNLSTLFSNTLSLCSSLNVSDQVSYTYKITSKIIVVCILTHCGRVTQICVFTLQLCRTGDAKLHF
jgi:hypothetical protein